VTIWHDCALIGKITYHKTIFSWKMAQINMCKQYITEFLGKNVIIWFLFELEIQIFGP
jgi:hypothetical protein